MRRLLVSHKHHLNHCLRGSYARQGTHSALFVPGVVVSASDAPDRGGASARVVNLGWTERSDLRAGSEPDVAVVIATSFNETNDAESVCLRQIKTIGYAAKKNFARKPLI